MLQRLDLNHATAVRQHHPLAIGLLLAGMLAVIALFLVLQHLDRRQTLLEEDMLRLRQPGTVQSARPDGKENTARREEITAVRTVLDELALPWQPLFTTLEKLNRPEVKLLEVTPHPQRHKLRITAQAQDASAMLNYVDNLNAAPIFGDVFLLSHEYTTGGSGMPIRFVTEAAWLF